MKGHGSKFGRKKEEAIVALLMQRNVDEAAKSVGITPSTLLRWMEVPEFATSYREARRRAFGQSIARLQQASTAAVSTLLKLMVDASTPPSVRVRAADSVLDHAKQAIEIEDVEVRVAALEEAAEITKQGR
jgi:transposase-like protein